MKILIKGGFMVDPANEICSRQDILIEDGKVSRILAAGAAGTAAAFADGHADAGSGGGGPEETETVSAAAGIDIRNDSAEMPKTKVSPAVDAAADMVIDAAGRVVCPGFVDIHMHEDPVGEDGRIVSDERTAIFPCMLRMGVTTAIGGNCGSNACDPAKYLDLVDRDGAPVNVGMLAGHNYYRAKAGCTDKYAPASAEQIRRIGLGVREALAGGCLGVSYGIRYAPGMDLEEMTASARECAAAAGEGLQREGSQKVSGVGSRCERSGESAAGGSRCEGVQKAAGESLRSEKTLEMTGAVEAKAKRQHRFLLAAHIRNDAAQVFASAQEFMELGRRLGVRLQISHIGSMAGFGQMEEFLAMVETERAGGMDVACDCYPYDAFCTEIGATTYDDGWMERYRCGYDAVEMCGGRYKGQRLTKETFGEMRRDDPDALTVAHVMKSRDIEMALTAPGVMLGSDGILDHGQGHPRAAGAFPRLIASYVRTGKLGLYDAVARMTAVPAERLGLENKGRLSVGADADIVIFDPERIADRATFSEPLLAPVGIDYVLIGGEIAAKDGRVVNGRLGRAVRA